MCWRSTWRSCCRRRVECDAVNPSGRRSSASLEWSQGCVAFSESLLVMKMMNQRLAWLALVAGLWFPAPITAHHWAEAQYDSQKVVTMTGTVTRMDWFNPHTHFYLDVKDGAGKVT